MKRFSLFLAATLALHRPALGLEPTVTANFKASVSCQAGSQTDSKSDKGDPVSVSCSLKETEGDSDERSSEALARANASSSAGVMGDWTTSSYTVVGAVGAQHFRSQRARTRGRVAVWPGSRARSPDASRRHRTDRGRRSSRRAR
jgi:hypothetical protein